MIMKTIFKEADFKKCLHLVHHYPSI